MSLPGSGNSQIELDFDNKYDYNDHDREPVGCQHEEWTFDTMTQGGQLWVSYEDISKRHIVVKIICEYCSKEGYYTIECDSKDPEIEWE